MKIAVIGSGNVGGTLGQRWAQGGHEVVYGVRDAAADKVRTVLDASGPNARAASVGEASAASDVVVLTTPWGATRDAVEAAGDLAGKVVVDCTNPIAAGLQGLSIGLDTSAGEQVAGWASGANVVKAFNTTGSNNMADPVYGGERVTMFYCGDDNGAKETVKSLIEELGFDACDAGPLYAARYLEPMAMLWVDMALLQGYGREFGYRIVRR